MDTARLTYIQLSFHLQYWHVQFRTVPLKEDFAIFLYLNPGDFLRSLCGINRFLFRKIRISHLSSHASHYKNTVFFRTAMNKGIESFPQFPIF